MSEPHEHHHHHHHEPLDYRATVEAFRADKDAFFREDPNSPVPVDERGSFAGLPYYPVDEGLRFEGLELGPLGEELAPSLEIGTSDGRVRHAHRAGSLRFDVDGQPCSLSALQFEGDDEGSVFVPFTDRTSGRETYGAGRYLDIEREDDGTWTVDFNLAYHPSCVYDPKYSCPLPPPENRLLVRIEAGERLAEDHE